LHLTLNNLHLLPLLVQKPILNFHFGIALAIFGAITLFLRTPGYDDSRIGQDAPRRSATTHLAILLLLVYIVNIVFALVYSVPDIEVFLTPSFVVIAIWIAAGCAFILDWLSVHLHGSTGQRVAFALSLVMLAVAVVALTRYTDVRAQVAQEAGTAESRARAILAPDLPHGSLLELDWETATAIRFLQTTEGTHTDLEARLIKLNARDEYFWALHNLDAGRDVYVEGGVKWTRAVAGYQTQSSTNQLARLTRATVELQPLDASLNNQVELVGMHNSRSGLMLYWRTRQPLARDLATYVHYFDADGTALGQDDRAACCEAIVG